MQPMPEPKKHGYFSLISLTLVIAFFVIGGGAAFLMHRTYSARQLITSTQKADIPIEPSAEKSVEINRRIEAFSTPSVGAGVEAQPAELALSADDINTLVANSPTIAGKAYFKIENDQVMVQSAVPLDAVPGFTGRYLNGNFSLKVAVENGLLAITPTSISTTDGQPIPPEVEGAILQALKTQNLNQMVNSDPRVQAWLKNITDIQVQDGNLVIKRR
jgi:hypothetical protein